MRTPHLRPFICLSLIALAVTAARAADAPGLTTILVVRHAEKLAPNGDPPLSDAGRARAFALASTLRSAGVRQIYTSGRIRTRETAVPLANQAAIAPQAIEDVDALVGKLRQLPRGAVALVVHHSNTIPAIIDKLSGTKVPPIADSEYDRLLVVTRAPDGASSVITLRYGPAAGARLR